MPSVDRAPSPGSRLRIAEMVVTPVACPDPPLRNVWGVHEPSFLRAVVQLRTEEGLEGLGEGPGGDLFVRELRAVARHVVGADPYQIERLRVLAGSNERVFAAVESACLDLIGQATGRSVCELLGGPVRRRVPFAAYLFFKDAGDDPWGPASTPEQIVRQAERFHERYGMTVFKLKGGVLDPWEEVAAVRLLRERFGPRAGLRLDPNAAWSAASAVRVAERLRDLDLEYLEDPTAGIEGMAHVARHTPIPLATNMCVTAFEQVAPAFRSNAVQVVLGDHHAWGGLTALRRLEGVCRTLGWGLSQHSNSHLGISFAGMIHAAAALPHLTYASDTHYPWNLHDIVRETDRFRFRGGAIEVWDAPGLGVTLDAEKFAAAAAAYERLGPALGRDDVGAMLQRDPEWLPLLPKW